MVRSILLFALTLYSAVTGFAAVAATHHISNQGTACLDLVVGCVASFIAWGLGYALYSRLKKPLIIPLIWAILEGISLAEAYFATAAITTVLVVSLVGTQTSTSTSWMPQELLQQPVPETLLQPNQTPTPNPEPKNPIDWVQIIIKGGKAVRDAKVLDDAVKGLEHLRQTGVEKYSVTTSDGGNHTNTAIYTYGEGGDETFSFTNGQKIFSIHIQPDHTVKYDSSVVTPSQLRHQIQQAQVNSPAWQRSIERGWKTLNAFKHGGKVNYQDYEYLRGVLSGDCFPKCTGSENCTTLQDSIGTFFCSMTPEKADQIIRGWDLVTLDVMTQLRALYNLLRDGDLKDRLRRYLEQFDPSFHNPAIDSLRTIAGLPFGCRANLTAFFQTLPDIGGQVKQSALHGTMRIETVATILWTSWDRYNVQFMAGRPTAAIINLRHVLDLLGKQPIFAPLARTIGNALLPQQRSDSEGQIDSSNSSPPPPGGGHSSDH